MPYGKSVYGKDYYGGKWYTNTLSVPTGTSLAFQEGLVASTTISVTITTPLTFLEGVVYVNTLAPTITTSLLFVEQYDKFFPTGIPDIERTILLPVEARYCLVPPDDNYRIAVVEFEGRTVKIDNELRNNGVS